MPFSPNVIFPMSMGKVGVVLFFAISGFVIALNRQQPVLEFIRRRVLRIYPIYWLSMLLAAVMFSAIGRSVHVIPAEILLYPHSRGGGSLWIPYWSLVYEVVFYVLAAVAFAVGLSDRVLTVIAIAWIAVVNLVGHTPSDPTEYNFPAGRILVTSAVQVFPMGLLCGIHFERLRRYGRVPIIVLTVFFAALSYNLEWFTTQKLFATGAACTLIVLACADIEVFRFVRTMGDASYGMYLAHFPILLVAASVIPGAGYPALLLIGVVGGTLFGLADRRIYRWLIVNTSMAGVIRFSAWRQARRGHGQGALLPLDVAAEASDRVAATRAGQDKEF